MDDFIGVSDDAAISMRRRLAQEEGLEVGFTSAANVVAAVALAESGKLGESPTIVTVLCDAGWKYGLS